MPPNFLGLVPRAFPEKLGNVKTFLKVKPLSSWTLVRGSAYWASSDIKRCGGFDESCGAILGHGRSRHVEIPTCQVMVCILHPQWKNVALKHAQIYKGAV